MGGGGGGEDGTGEMASGVPGLMNPYVRVEDKLCKVPLSWKVVRDLPGPPGS